MILFLPAEATRSKYKIVQKVNNVYPYTAESVNNVRRKYSVVKTVGEKCEVFCQSTRNNYLLPQTFPANRNFREAAFLAQ